MVYIYIPQGIYKRDWYHPELGHTSGYLQVEKCVTKYK